MDVRDLITDGLERGHGIIRRVLENATPELMAYQASPGANPVGWLAWHVMRVQDHHIAGLSGAGQAWLDEGWHERFGMAAESEDYGTGHTPEQMTAVGSPGARLLLEYDDAVWARTTAYLAVLTGEGLDRVLDEPQYRPLPTVAVRLVSLINHSAHHAGQIDYLRGLAGHPR
ncbi:MAG: DinB family protein [Chloroflexi bacterium]|nr:DinB family protein [Chloroflexota bacterium]